MFSLETVSVLKLVKMFTNVGNSSTRARNKSPFQTWYAFGTIETRK